VEEVYVIARWTATYDSPLGHARPAERGARRLIPAGSNARSVRSVPAASRVQVTRPGTEDPRRSGQRDEPPGTTRSGCWRHPPTAYVRDDLSRSGDTDAA